MALNTLSNECLVLQRPYAGWQVITLEKQDLWEIYHLRVALETEASRMAAEQMNTEKREKLKNYFSDYLALCESPNASIIDVSTMDLGLHRLIIE